MRFLGLTFFLATALLHSIVNAADIEGKYMFKDDTYTIKMDIAKFGSKYSVLIKGTGGRDKFEPEMPTHSSYVKTDKCSYSDNTLSCEYYNKVPLLTDKHSYNFKITFKNNDATLEQTGGECDVVANGNYGGVIIEQTYKKVK